MNNYCTLFDSNYLSRGLLMYESLISHQPGAHLFIFPFDEKCCSLLKAMDLLNVTIISMNEFENTALLETKQTRSAAEYCWTCTPSIIAYVLDNYKVDSCTYLDADLYFYKDPSLLINQMPNSFSVLITPHRYTHQNAITDAAGIYCVQFLTFKNNEDGKKVLEWWRLACIEWCFNRVEDGKFGDQKYLDDWTERFKEEVWELEHPGAGVAPWNVQQFSFIKSRGKITGIEKKSGNTFDLYFYHFHSFSFEKITWNRMSIQSVKYVIGYLIPRDSINLIYNSYSKKLLVRTEECKKLYNIPVYNSIITKSGLKHFLKALITTAWLKL